MSFFYKKWYGLSGGGTIWILSIKLSSSRGPILVIFTCRSEGWFSQWLSGLNAPGFLARSTEEKTCWNVPEHSVLNKDFQKIKLFYQSPSYCCFMRVQATWRKENAGLLFPLWGGRYQTSKFKDRLAKDWILIIGRDYVCPPSSTLDHHNPAGAFPEVMPSFTRYTETKGETQTDEAGNLRNRLGYGKDVGIVQPEMSNIYNY